MLPSFANASISSEKVPVRSSVNISSSKINAACLLNLEAPQTLKDLFSKIPLGNILKPLGELEIAKNELEQLLGSLSELVELPSRVIIRRTGEIFPGSLLIEKIRATRLSHAKENGVESIEMDFSRLPKHLVLPAPLDSWDVQAISTNVLGMGLFSVEILCKDGSRIHRIFQTEAWEVVSAAKVVRLLKPKQKISKNDVVEEQVKIRSKFVQPLLRYNDVLGKISALFKSPGTYIREGDIVSESNPGITQENYRENLSHLNDQPENARAPELVIKTGETVEFFVKTGGLSLTVPAKALESGALGESIRLVNLQNHKPLFGKVISEGKVEYVQK